VRFDGRISEKSAERSVRSPLTLMNSARRAAVGRGRSKRKKGAGTPPPPDEWENLVL
jgi:hypothetical protein